MLDSFSKHRLSYLAYEQWLEVHHYTTRPFTVVKEAFYTTLHILSHTSVTASVTSVLRYMCQSSDDTVCQSKIVFIDYLFLSAHLIQLLTLLEQELVPP